jgi:DNA-binding protein HU-beta
MTKKELALLISETNDISQTKASEMIDMVVGGIVNGLESGKDVTIRGFGSFKTVNTAARSGRNLRTQERVVIPAKARVKFKSYMEENEVTE